MLPVTVTQGFHGKTDKSTVIGDPGEDLLVLVCVRKELLEHTFLLPYGMPGSHLTWAVDLGH